MDGNYDGTFEIRLEACDTVILLDLARTVCLYRVLKRTITYYGKSRRDLNPGCRSNCQTGSF